MNSRSYREWWRLNLERFSKANITHIHPEISKMDVLWLNLQHRVLSFLYFIFLFLSTPSMFACLRPSLFIANNKNVELFWENNAPRDDVISCSFLMPQCAFLMAIAIKLTLYVHISITAECVFFWYYNRKRFKLFFPYFTFYSDHPRSDFFL